MANDALEMNINLFILYQRRFYHFYSFIIYYFSIIICFVVTSLFRSHNVPSGDPVGPVQGGNQLDIKASRHVAQTIILGAFKTEQSMSE